MGFERLRKVFIILRDFWVICFVIYLRKWRGREISLSCRDGGRIRVVGRWRVGNSSLNLQNNNYH